MGLVGEPGFTGATPVLRTTTMRGFGYVFSFYAKVGVAGRTHLGNDAGGSCQNE